MAKQFRVAHTGHTGTAVDRVAGNGSTCGCKAKPQATAQGADVSFPSPSADALRDAIHVAREPEPRDVALAKGLRAGVNPTIGAVPVDAPAPAPTTTAAPCMAAAIRAARS